MNEPILVLLAAGLSRRYGALKQLDGLGPAGETLMDYALYDAHRAGFRRAIAVVRPEIEAEIRSVLSPAWGDCFDLRFARQRVEVVPEPARVDLARKKPWGTAHALWSCRKLIDAPFAVVNADDFYGREAYRRALEELGDFSSVRREGAVLAYPAAETLSENGGVTRALLEADARGCLRSIVELSGVSRGADGAIRGTDSTGLRLPLADEAGVSMNFWMFSRSFLPALESSLERFLRLYGEDESRELPIPEAVSALLGPEFPVRVRRVPGPWIGVTYPEDRERARWALEALEDGGFYPTVRSLEEAFA
jgi:hypothetical protein